MQDQEHLEVTIYVTGSCIFWHLQLTERCTVVCFWRSARSSSDRSLAHGFTTRSPWNIPIHSSPFLAVCLLTHITPQRRRKQHCQRTTLAAVLQEITGLSFLLTSFYRHPPILGTRHNRAIKRDTNQKTMRANGQITLCLSWRDWRERENNSIVCENSCVLSPPGPKAASVSWNMCIFKSKHQTHPLGSRRSRTFSL